ncbi:MAG: thiamine phosphate synthase [Pseudomonadota bacterium]
MSLDRFYPIFDSSAWLARMLPRGVRFVQLRIKDTDESRLRDEIGRAQALADAHGATLVVNDHWALAIELGCRWVHLGQEDLDDADVPALRAAGIKLGLSTHDEAELARALAFEPDYVALGPIYPTILKKMKWTQQGLPRLAAWREAVGRTPLVAIGGFTVERVAGAFEHGADSVSAVTDITLNPDPEARVDAWLRATQEPGG